MVKLIYKKRAIFPKGRQSKFLLNAFNKSHLSWFELAKKINIHERTLNDWKREQYSMPIDKLKKICDIANINMPDVVIKDPFWYVNLGAKNGGLATIKKYGRVGGDPEYRKKKWYEWWEKEGKNRKDIHIGKIKNIRIPSLSKELAEFTGIVMGDGGITQNQVMISTNSIDDKKYGYFIKKLIKKLFNVNASIYYTVRARVMIIAVSRKKLVEFCNKKLELKIGNKLKQGLDIPNWIKGNLEFEKVCVRGLIDTDGSIFNECHNINGKKYNYKRLNFTSASPELRKSVFNILQKNGLSPKIRNNRCVQIEDKAKIKEYFEIIGTHNPKHLKRYYK
ncbi:MAG: hypothetical protein A2402_02610 [Candidatus Staskawiczbacteria bacterium RIFOXYC1_FULL_37_43]|nr:MAG: hypothetical protein A2813_03615 [Candidatus Staskawiczbacteria bacterium RIFCSPHIGHO2_01_FULL_37_17]OGZ71176.1 MAG: hypothetical protein A2891_03955 [Candidatus Staskawiczbacteria bacterium RIFCSPLOWO2_01_FULL_37_19]OGZ76256.1 MAG: hypothetical protein A2205_00560 [Candidatus Staskawiczbacteria bacterium RIFOXYA1_FULL_37_15]OGZ77627.1 MAG: hypothetical protein A2280_03515 [Candidatus Staskawiczbacteria bacterium RIFOXYA12_FULL_37_10]OGZ80270.1 MAG: hypothetical protein A2353_03270 [Can